MLQSERLKFRSKRSGQVGLTLMASRMGGVIGGAALLAGCGSEPAAPSAQAEDAGPKLEVQAYENVFECAANSGMTQQECTAAREQAVAEAAKTAPRFAATYDCEAEWGQGNCVPQKAEGQSFFMPFVGGFLLGKMLQDNRREIMPLFRKNGDSALRTANGVRLGYNGGPGKYLAAARAFEKPASVPKIASASAAAAKGGLTQSGDSRSGRGGGFVVGADRRLKLPA